MEPTWITLAFIHCVLDVNSNLDLGRAPLPPMSILLLLAIFPGSGRVTSGQRLPSRDEEQFRFQIKHREVFYDTRRLPDGVEKKVFLPKSDTERYYFLVTENDTPLSLTLTPCTHDTIKWRLLYQEYPTKDVKPTDSHNAGDDLFAQREASSRSQDDRYILVDTHLSGARSTYTIGQALPGLFTLELVSPKRDAALQVFATTFLVSKPYPELPADAEVRAVQNTDQTVTVSWKRSPTDTLHEQSVEYCIAVNNVRNLDSQCTALSLSRGDQLVLPPHVGFGFPWEKAYKNITIETSSDDVTYLCVGKKTSFTLDRLSPGLRHYLDVFVVSAETNSSTAYTGTSVKIKLHKSSHLKDGKIRTAVLTRPDKKYFTFKLARKTNNVYVTVQPCDDPVYVQMYRNGRLIDTNTVSDSLDMLFQYRNAGRGTYLVVVVPLADSAKVKVAYTTSRHSVPYPTMPRDTHIHVISNKTTCDSVTVAWAVSDEAQQHCIYLQRVGRHHREKHPDGHRRNTCISNKHRKRKYKVKCVQIRAGHGDTQTETLSGLKPNSLYAINIYATRHSRQWLPYRHVHTTTSAAC